MTTNQLQAKLAAAKADILSQHGNDRILCCERVIGELNDLLDSVPLGSDQGDAIMDVIFWAGDIMDGAECGIASMNVTVEGWA